jgi:hypothetical protein
VSYAVSGPATVSGSTLAITGAGTVKVTASQAGNSSYAAATPVSQSFTVNPATLTVTASNVTVAYNQPIPALTGYAATGFVNGDPTAVLSGAPAESTTATQGSPAGTYPITITQGTLAAANYTFSFVSGTLTISGGAAQTITFAALANVTYGVSPITLTATASSGLPVSYAVSGPATVSGSTLAITGAGTVKVTASQAGNSSYAAATPVSQSFTVAKATPTITWATPAAITYGTPLGSAQLNAQASYNGINLTGTYNYGSIPVPVITSGAILPAGNIQLVVVFQPSDSADYAPAFGDVFLQVNKASTTTTITAMTKQTVAGTTATLTTTISPQISGTPTGTVTYTLGSTTLGTAVVGTAFTTPVLPVGTDQLTAVYSGDSNFTTSSASVAVTGVAPTLVTLNLLTDRVLFPLPAVYSVEIRKQRGQALSGTVTLYDGNTALCTTEVPPDGILIGITPLLSVGVHNLRAVYNGNSAYPPGESQIETVTVVDLF